MSELTHMSLFSGIGGLDLAAEWAGFQTVCQCEIADFPTRVLEKNWPEVPRFRDIHDITALSFQEKTGQRSVTVVSGGFPCQPFSVAGRQRGQEDDRFLWPEMVRVIAELRPYWVLGENVPNLLRLGIETILSDLEGIGYEPGGGVFLIPAEAVGAAFAGDRVFIAAADRQRRYRVEKEPAIKPNGVHQENLRRWTSESDDLLLHLSRMESYTGGGGERNDNGISEGVDRLKAIGNAVVPFHAYPFFQAIAAIEEAQI